MEIDKDESAAGLDALLIERARIEEKIEERMKDKTIGDNEEIIENGQNNENVSLEISTLGGSTRILRDWW